jgi:hypothetical protein
LLLGHEVVIRHTFRALAIGDRAIRDRYTGNMTIRDELSNFFVPYGTGPLYIKLKEYFVENGLI